MNYISRYCRIRDRILSRQGSVLFNSPAGDLDAFLEHVFAEFSISYPKFYKMDRLSKLGFLGTEILLHDLQLAELHKPEQVALVLSNAHASLDTDMRYFETTKTIANPA